MSERKILVHFPTRGRREQAKKTIQGYFDLCDRPHLVRLTVAGNEPHDLPEPHIDGFEVYLDRFASEYYFSSPFRSKIAAYNAIPTDLEWDIVLAASDDMWCIQPGWDTIIREAMAQHFPDLDGCLWFSDGRQDRICTFSIMGRKAYERDGYIYHNDYLSFFCDNEWTEVWEARGKLHKDQQCLFRNEHYAWGGVMQEDQTYRDGAGPKNIKWNHDKQLYHERKLQGFP